MDGRSDKVNRMCESEEKERKGWKKRIKREDR